MKLLYKDEAYAAVGACCEVYNELGSGFLEDFYHEALKVELDRRSIPFVSKPKLEIHYKGKLLTQKYEPDFVLFSKIIMELKAARSLLREHRAQVMNYLKLPLFSLGIL